MHGLLQGDFLVAELHDEWNLRALIFHIKVTDEELSGFVKVVGLHSRQCETSMLWRPIVALGSKNES